MKSIYRAIAPILVATLLLLTACDKTAPPPVKGGSSSPSTTTTKKTPATKQTPAPPSKSKSKSAATTPADTSKKSSSTKDIASLPPQKGSAFNKFLPDANGTEYKRTFSQEKTGFAEIKLTLKNAEVARISISDTVTNLTARNKYQGAKDQVNGFPMITEGKNSSSVLVGDRYQVKVMSRAATFTAADREAWLAKVDLQGLARLK